MRASLILAVLLIAGCKTKTDEPRAAAGAAEPKTAGATEPKTAGGAERKTTGAGGTSGSGSADGSGAGGSGAGSATGTEAWSIAKQIVVAIGSGDPKSIEPLYMTADEVKSMAECAKDQVAMRDENLAAVRAAISRKPAEETLVFTSWTEQPVVRLAKGAQAAGCTARVDLEITNGTIEYTATKAGGAKEQRRRAASIVKTATGWKISRLDDH